MNLHDLAPYAAAAATWLLPSPLKRGLNVNVVAIARTVLVFVGLAVVIAEDVLGPGTGPDKRAKVLADLKAQMPGALALSGVPEWLVGFLCSDAVLGLAIDMVVQAGNAAGNLGKQPA